MKQCINLLLAVLLLLVAQSAMAQGVMVYGTITNNVGQPVPGIMVSLFHPMFGRSVPAYSDGWGRYALYNVPPNQQPYFIEAYWGPQLIYRNQIYVYGPLEWHIMLN